MTTILNQYSREELEQIVKNSFSLSEVNIKIGYATNTGVISNTLKAKLNNWGIDYSHFTSNMNRIVRTVENIFIENSTANQSTLRKWYREKINNDYKCSICGQKSEWQGKPLTMTLDHINGNTHDNRTENLRWVCPNCDRQLPTFGSKNRQSVVVKQYFCIECGAKVSKKDKRCQSCAAKEQRTCIRPSRKELKRLVRTETFVKIGKQYKVSDNAIKKWCKTENLPHLRKDIKQYTDKEWEDI